MRVLLSLLRVLVEGDGRKSALVCLGARETIHMLLLPLHWEPENKGGHRVLCHQHSSCWIVVKHCSPKFNRGSSCISWTPPSDFPLLGLWSVAAHLQDSVSLKDSSCWKTEECTWEHSSGTAAVSQCTQISCSVIGRRVLPPSCESSDVWALFSMPDFFNLGKNFPDSNSDFP